MDSQNPFAAPTAASPTSNQVPAHGAWRDGPHLVITKAAQLPDRCIRCNEPAAGKPMRFRLSWHSPLAYLGLFLGLLPYIIAATIMMKRMDIHVGVCAGHKRKRQGVILASALGIIAGLTMLILPFFIQKSSAVLFLAAFAMIVVSLSAGIYGARIVSPKRIEKDLAWVNGACDQYLEGFPDFPG